MTIHLQIAALTALAFLAGSVGLATDSVAQRASTEPYSRLIVSATAGWDLGQGRFQDHWTTGVTPGAHLRVPARIGDLEFGVGVARNWFQGGPEADFWSTLLQFGWGHSLELVDRLIVEGTLHAGMYLMMFDEQPIGYARRESELMLGGSIGARVPVSRQVRVMVRTGMLRVYTSTPIDIVHVTGGLALVLETPAWLRPLLR